MGIKASLASGSKNAGQHLLSDGATGCPISTATDLPRNDRTTERLLGAPVRCVNLYVESVGSRRIDASFNEHLNCAACSWTALNNARILYWSAAYAIWVVNYWLTLSNKSCWTKTREHGAARIAKLQHE